MRQIINKAEFEESLGKNAEYAFKKFQETEPEENGMIISNYDDEGYCIFEPVGNNDYEFTGTAK